MATLQDVVDELNFQTEFINLGVDNMSAFTKQLQDDAAAASLDAAEARKEGANSLAGAGEEGITGDGPEAEPLGDPVIPSKEAGMIAALGTAFLKGGLGIGVAAAGIGYLISQVNEFGPALSKMATGLEDLENTEVTGEQFRLLGSAIGDLVAGAGISGAIGIRILSGAAFSDLAEGIERLDKAEFDPKNLKAVGTALTELTKDKSMMGALTTFIMGSTDFGALADGINKLDAIKIGDDFENRMAMTGGGISQLLSGTGGWFGNLLDATTFQMIDDNLSIVAEGVKGLNEIDTEMWAAKAPVIGKGLGDLLSGTGGFFGNMLDAAVFTSIDDNLKVVEKGIKGLNTIDAELWTTQSEKIGQGLGNLLGFGSFFTSEMGNASILEQIDDNLIPMIDGIKHITNTLSEEEAEKFEDLSEHIGDGLGKLLGFGDVFTSEMGNATILQMVDDNLIPLADGVKYMSDVGGDVKFENIQKIVKGFNEIAGMKTVNPTQLADFRMLLGTVAPTSTLRTNAIEQSTPIGGEAAAPIIISENKSSTSTVTSIKQEAPSLPSPTSDNGSRAGAYAAA